MKEILIHIGTGKTGSTALQACLYEKGLPGISYPRIRGANHNSLNMVYEPFEDWNPVFHRQFGRLNDTEISRIKRKFRHKYQRTFRRCTRLILSSEIIHRFGVDQILEFKKDLIDAGFERFLIVMYVRHPAEHYLSRMQQRLRHFTYFENPKAYHFPYRKIIENWESVFPDRLLVRKFERSGFRNHDVMSDFLDVVNDFFDESIADPDSVTIRNESFSVEQMAVLQGCRKEWAMNDQFDLDPRFEKLLYLIKQLTQESGLLMSRPVLRQSVAKLILSNHEDELRYLRNQYGISFSQYNNEGSMSSSFTFPEIETSNIISICSNFNQKTFIRLNALLLGDVFRRHINESRYIDWFRVPYWNIRKFAKGITKQQ